MLALALFLLLNALGSQELMRTQSQTKTTAALFAEAEGEFFLAYRNAVRTFVARNPTFTGTVSVAQLNGLGYSFPSSLSSRAGNVVTTYGTSGRMIISFAALTPGAIAHAFELSEFDASLGLSNGSTWTSNASGAIPQALPTPITQGSIVSVIVFGN